MKKAVIIGAGISGCLPGMLLSRKGWSVTIIEKASFIGGGLRTFFHGGHPYTYGPRHFLSPYKEAYDFLIQYVPMRPLKKINYTYIEKDQAFYTFPIHEDDIDTMPEALHIRKELAARPETCEPRDFEEFWIARVGETLYNKFVKEYNKKAWMLNSNTEMDLPHEGFVKSVSKNPLETGDRYEFKGWYNCYPIARDGYNRFFDIAVEGCEVRLNTTITRYDIDRRAVYVGDENISGDILISTISPDVLMDYRYGELRYIGREFHKIVLPIEFALPEDVYFLYYPNGNEIHTRIVEYKKFTLHKSPHTLLGFEVPSLKNKLYPYRVKAEVERAKRYLAALPKNVYSLGRMGMYEYIDTDDIIMQSLRFVEHL